MEDGEFPKLIFSSLLSVIVIMLPVFCYGYSNQTTHPALTNETIDVFNYKYPEFTFSENERNMILRGSVKEDDPFYRPLK